MKQKSRKAKGRRLQNFVRDKTRYFKAYCEVRVIPANEAGSKYLFRDPMIKKEEDE